MARFGKEQGERGVFRDEIDDEGVAYGYFVPTVNHDGEAATHPLNSLEVEVIRYDPDDELITISPIDTRHWTPGYLKAKYSQIKQITLTGGWGQDVDLRDALEDLPSGFIKDFEYGLGLTRECDPLIRLIEEHTACSIVAIDSSENTWVDGDTFRLSSPDLAAILAEVRKIKARAQSGVERATATYVHNTMAETFSLEKRDLSLGRLPVSRWLTKVAAGNPVFSQEEETVLLDAVSASAPQIAEHSPEKLAKLRRDIEFVSLKDLLGKYEDALQSSFSEQWWQEFFEANLFVLQLVFGGPTQFVSSQVSIGASQSPLKGRKIADYLFKNPLTNNAALVEIKKPTTRILKRNAYRSGVFGVCSEIGESVVQVLHQSHLLTREEGGTKSRLSDSSWATASNQCFIVVGRSAELDSDEKKASFEIFRGQMSSVRIVTFDEIFTQLRDLMDFLFSSDEDVSASA